jgi:tetratricopeptide (TPR) repeat protein
MRRLFAMLAIFCAGCGTRATSTSSTPHHAQRPPATVAATRPVSDPKALLTLDQIEPRPVLPATATAATDPDQPPASLDALELYARARDALASGERFTAVNLLERVVRLDPGAAEPRRLLSRALSAAGNSAGALEALRRAAEIEPNDAATQASVGRLYLLRGDAVSATRHLRLALQTEGYRTDEGTAAVVDYFLARALQQQGYDRAALDQYLKVLSRLAKPALAIRGDPELRDWAERPEAVYAEAARLHARLGEHDAALSAWRRVAERAPDDFDVRRSIVSALMALDRRDEAVREAADVLRREGAASTRAIELLRDVCRRGGDERAALDQLRRLLDERPGDRSILFALCDLLVEAGRDDEARDLLAESARRTWDAETVRKLVHYYSERHRARDAALLLIDAAAARPTEVAELARQFQQLARPHRRDWLRTLDVQRLDVNSPSEVARLYFVAMLARGQRDALAGDALERAVKIDPPFAPAFRELLGEIWARQDLDGPTKSRRTDELIRAARERSDPTLAEELTALALLNQNRVEEAAAAMDLATRSRGRGAKTGDVDLIYADLQRLAGNHARFEQVVWRVISDHPTWQAAYVRLINHHVQQSGGSFPSGAVHVVQRWLSADPSSDTARMVEAQLLAQTGRGDDGTRIATEVVRRRPLDPEILSAARQVFAAASRGRQFTQLVEELHARDAKNLAVTELLVELYVEQQRQPEAIRAIDESRAASTGESKLLYYVAQLYNRLDQKEASEQALLSVLNLAPDDPGANNDLAYNWADHDVNLERAESMTRKAVDAEPDNSSFLDSLGWVLYKRGRFAEACDYLRRAADAGSGLSPPDPIVLDHLGDALYRLDDRAAAREQWTRAQAQLGTDAPPAPLRRVHEALRQSVQLKLRQLEQNQPVSVATAPGSPSDGK